MCECNENKEIDNNVGEEQDIEVNDFTEGLDYLAFAEEQKRINIQDDPYSITSEDTKNSKFYKESIIIAETVGEVFQKLLGYGVDYNNSLAIASGLVSNDATLQITKATSEKIEEQQRI